MLPKKIKKLVCMHAVKNGLPEPTRLGRRP